MKRMIRRSLAAAELLLVFPAALFMTALFVRNIQPQQYEPAHSAQRIVEWYAGRPHVGLWVLMIALPLLVLVAGAMALVRSWQRDEGLREDVRNTIGHLRTHFATFLIFAATAAAAGILMIVAVHVLTD
jgi:ABC-type Fe3+ transport system permease subunit